MTRISFRNLKTLQIAVIASVFLALAAPSLLGLAIDRKMSEERARTELAGDLERATTVLSLSLAAPLWDLSLPNVEAIVRAMIQDERIVSITVNDRSQDKPFFSLTRSGDHASDNVVSHQAPILRDGDEIGAVNVVMTVRPYLEASRERSQRNLVLLLTVLGIAMIAITLVLRTKLLAPVEHLAEEARRLADGNLTAPIRIDSDAELGRVATAMEHMRCKLLESFDELQRTNSQLSEYAQTLESRVSERTIELQKALDSLKLTQRNLVESEKLASLGRLVAGVAHELNTPIGNALTVVTTQGGESEEIKAMVDSGKLQRSKLLDFVSRAQSGQLIAQRNLERAAEIITNFKQLSVDQTTDMRRRFDLAQVIQEVLTSIQPSFRSTPFRIEADLEKGIEIDSYPGPLGQVITNIALNALTHAFEGREGGMLSIRCRSTEDGRHACITCRDDGIGMDETTRLKVFDPFFTTKMGRGGTGLGLHISYTYVTGLLGGQIEVNSSPGHGSEFLITLPVRV